MSEYLKDVLALAIAIALLLLVWLPTWGGMFRLPPNTDRGSRTIRSQSVSAIGAARAVQDAPTPER